MECPSPRALALADLIARIAATAQSRTVAFAKALARGTARRWQGRLDLRRLQDMDDRLLEDIGVDRHEIGRAVGKGPWLDDRLR